MAGEARQVQKCWSRACGSVGVVVVVEAACPSVLLLSMQLSRGVPKSTKPLAWGTLALIATATRSVNLELQPSKIQVWRASCQDPPSRIARQDQTHPQLSRRTPPNPS